MPELLGYQFDRTFALPIERYRQLSTIAERDAIPTGKRWRGMLCYVTGEENDYQLRGGITNGDWVAASAGNYFDLANNDSDDITEGVINLFLTSAEQTKLSFITITQAVDLDALETAVAALGSGLTPKGGWDASSGSFPGGGTAQIGEFWFVTVAGTVDSVSFAVNETIVSLATNASTTTFSPDWFRGDVTNAVTSVVGLTGAISKAALLAALNVEDGATADMTGSEISAAITSFLTSADWQTKLTNEEVLDFVGAAINSGTQTKITVEYDDPAGVYNFTVDPFIIVYANLATLVAAQGSQVDDIVYEITDASGFTGITSGRAWVRYKGTANGLETDYIIMSKEESVSQTAPIPLTYADLATLIAGQGAQILNFIYEVTDGSGFTGVTSGAVWVKYLGTTVGDETDYTIISKEDIEGTAILSTGEAGNAKFLGENGDGTSSWKALPGGGDMLVSTYDPATVSEQLTGLTATQTLTNKTLTSPVINTGVSGTAVLDDDTFAAANATTLATSESIKAYVDASGGSGDVVGPAVVVDEDIAVFDGTTGKLIKAADTSAGTGTAITLALTGRYFNTATPSTATTFTITGATQIGAWARARSSSATASEPTVTGATNEGGVEWQVGVEHDIFIVRDDEGVKFSFIPTEITIPVGDRLEEDLTVTGTKNIDWDLYETFRFTLTGDCTFSDTNLPVAGSKAITIYMDGAFTPTWPVGWTTYISGSYNTAELNTIVAEYVKATTPFLKVQISQPD